MAYYFFLDCTLHATKNILHYITSLLTFQRIFSSLKIEQLRRDSNPRIRLSVKPLYNEDAPRIVLYILLNRT